MKKPKGIWKKMLTPTLVGGLAFWLANFAISRTEIAAEYRAAMSISYYPMLMEALAGLDMQIARSGLGLGVKRLYDYAAMLALQLRAHFVSADRMHEHGTGLLNWRHVVHNARTPFGFPKPHG